MTTLEVAHIVLELYLTLMVLYLAWSLQGVWDTLKKKEGKNES